MKDNTTARHASSYGPVVLSRAKAWIGWRKRVHNVLEEDYLATHLPISLRIMRTWLAVGIVLDLAMVWDVALTGRSATRPSLVIELGLHLPLVVGLCWILNQARGVQLRESAFITAALARLLCIGMESGLGPLSSVSRYQMLAATTLFSALLLVPLRTCSATLFALLGFAATVAMTVMYRGPGAGGTWDLLIFTGVLALMGLRARMGLNKEGHRSHSLRVQDQRHREELARSNARLLELSDTDPLTGVGNRRSFEQTLNRLVQSGTGGHLALVMIDVDHFKRFNDTYGHLRGDECLQMIARALREQIRDVQDHVARFGGEEFVAVLPDADLNATLEVADRMRLAVSALKLSHSGRPEPPMLVTVSVGVASVIMGSNARQILVTNADEALYAAKAAGRNCVRCKDETVTNQLYGTGALVV